MKKLAKFAIQSAYGKIDPNKKDHSFEVKLSIKFKHIQIFGLDFMIDQNFKFYLIEINTNPCLDTSSPILLRLIPSMID